MKMYGPYQRKDGRRHVIWYDFEAGIRRTQSYPRFLMEQFLERELETWEEVDHINEDHTDDRIENYQILTKPKNISKSSKPAAFIEFECPTCNKTFLCKRSRYKHNQLAQGKDGPFCSKSCVGKKYH